MKVGIVITRLPGGGASRLALKTALRLRKDGHKVFMAAGTKNTGENSYWPEVERSGVPFIKLQYLRRTPGFQDLIGLIELYRVISREQPDLLHLHTSKAGTLGAIAGRSAGVPKIVYSSHGHPFHPDANIEGFSPNGILGSIFYVVRIVTNHLVDRVVALSEIDKHEQMELGFGSDEKFCVIHNGIDTDEFRQLEFDEELREKLRVTEAEPLLINVGRLVKEKGQESLIEAVAELVENYPAIELLLVGEGPRRDKLNEMIRDLGLTEEVHLLGFRSDVKDILSIGDIFCFPSFYESQGLALIEAMGAGLPCISTLRGGLKELVKPGETALKVKPGEPDELAMKIRQLKEQPEFAEALGKRARRYVFKNYSLDRMLDRTLDLYRDVLDEG